MSAPVRPRWPELSETQRHVLLQLLLSGEQPRIRLAERVGLSRASLTRIARELVDMGLAAEGATLQLPGRGRPAELLHLRSDASHFVGVKLTGDALYAVLTDLAGTIVGERDERLPSREVGAVVPLIAEVADALFSEVAMPGAIGIGLAGDMHARGGTTFVEGSHFLGWDGVPLADLVADATGLPVTTVNDVHALAAAHHWFGSGADHSSIVVYGVGAGIGSGVVVDGELREGSHGRSGRVGHLRIGGVGRRCANGHVDCVHSFVTMPAIEHNSGVGPDGYPRAVELARAGEERAADAFAQAARALGAVVAEAVNAHDPGLVSLMGEGLDMLELAPDRFDEGLAEFLEQVDPAAVMIDRPAFAFSLYARGAAVAAERQLLT
jgi:predicted NBD/HSP70 family sugar kinase